jgi:L-threonylcarbamoyladenylate synthase
MNARMPRRLTCETGALDPDAVTLVQAAIAAGELIAYPTDTFYGLGVDPRQAAAIEAIFHAKGRASESAIPLIAADIRQVTAWFGALSPLAARLAAQFWPGPLTLVIPLRSAADVAAAPHAVRLPDALTSGLDSIAIRVPDHAIARAVAAAAGGVITSTSANLSGHPPVRTADEVLRDMGASLSLIVDAGMTPGGLPSTIVDVTHDAPRLVRPGLVPWERVLESIQ